MPNMKRVSAGELKKAKEQMKSKSKVKITGTATTTPRVSNSMIKSAKGSNTKPFNVGLIKPSEIIKDKPKAKPGVRKPMPKVTGAKPGVKKPMPLTGPAAVEALQRRVSPSGVKKAESGAKKAIDKKYPGLYKKK